MVPISRILRFGMELKNVSETVKDCQFVVFKGAMENGGSVRGINAEGQGAMPRKKIDALVEYAKGFGAKGLAYIWRFRRTAAINLHLPSL